MRLTSTGTGARLTLHVQPGASHSEVAGVHGDALKLRIRAVPEKGRANDAVIAFLAHRLRVPAVRIRIVSGLSSRRKVVDIEGVTVTEVALALGMETA